MAEIVISKTVKLFLSDVVDTLYDNEYFGFEDDALKYVEKIYSFIYNELPNIQYKKTPKRLLKYGVHYSVYRVNKRTAWYVFFNKKDNRYIIKHITNNHFASSAFLNGL